jgi:hypothetical protein
MAAVGALAATALVVLTGCGGSGSGSGSGDEGAASPTRSSGPPAHSPGPAITPLPTTGAVDYQLGGAYPPPKGVTVVERDAGDRPAPHTYSICYVNGFQTQPDQAARWSGPRAELLLRGSDGRPVSDPDWPGEHILDPTTPAKRAGILAVLAPVIRSCATKGFQAVEIDNLDTFTRFHRIPESATEALARAYVRTAHAAGLAIAQKNAAESSRTARSWGFDFAVAEECHVYDECGAYTAVYGKRVIEVEYTDNLRTPFASLCRAENRPPLLVLRDRDLTTPASPHYRDRTC